MERLKERLMIAGVALGTLQELLDTAEISKVKRDAAIQRFEYTFEAVWKGAQRYLSVVEGLELGSPKGVIRASMQVGLIDETTARMALVMTDDRNLTVHTYNEGLAETIYSRLPEYADLMDLWLKAMEEAAHD